MEWINPDKLLPDRSGDYRIKIEGDILVGRFNKGVLASYWSEEAICKTKVIGWLPLESCQLTDDN